MKRLLCLGLIAFLWSMASPIAFADTLDLSKVKKTLVDLGYEPTTDHDQLTVAGLGASKSDINFRVNDSKLTMFSNFSIPPEKQGSIPMVDLLKANSYAQYAFALYGDPGSLSLDMEATFDGSVVNKKMLRASIDGLVAAIDSNDALWNSDKWPSAASEGSGKTSQAKTYQDFQDEADATWEKSPLAIRTAAFAAEKIAGYRDYAKRADSTFKTSDTMHLYIEPADWVWKQEGSGNYSFNLSADVLVKSKDGKVYLDQKNVATSAATFKHKMKIVDFSIDYGLDGLDPGTDYVMTATVHDRVGSKTASIDLPFTVTK